MQYTKPMVDLVYEIRRRVESNLKPSVKMANPEVLKELADYYHHTKDTVCKALIKELLFMAGEPWSLLLNPPPEKPEPPKQQVKVYRGQTLLEDAPPNFMATTKMASPPKPQRMYRGHPVD